MTDNPRAEALCRAINRMVGELQTAHVECRDEFIASRMRRALEIADRALDADRDARPAQSSYLNRPLRTLEQAKAEAGR